MKKSILPKMIKDNVLIRVPKEKKTKSGVYLPETTIIYRMANAGVVVGVGPESTLKKGDFVFWREGIGNLIQDEFLSEDFFFVVVSENDILGYYSAKEMKEIQKKDAN